MLTPAILPLNHRGAVYHLDLLPEEIADVIFTVGDPARVSQLSQHFDSIEIKRSHREFITHTGYLNKQRISVISTGIGVPNIDIVMNELDAIANINLVTRKPHKSIKQLIIIRLGTTGGIQTECKPGDIHISQYAIGFDTLLNYYQRIMSSNLNELQTTLTNYLDNESPSFYSAEADNSLVNHFADLGTVGISATCGGFYGPQGRSLRLPLRYPQLLEKLMHFKFSNLPIINLEMETAAILGLGQLLGHRCLSVGVVLTNRVNGLFVKNVESTVEHLIEHAIQKIGVFV